MVFLKNNFRVLAAISLSFVLIITLIMKDLILQKQKSLSFINYKEETLPGWKILFFKESGLPYIRYKLFLPYAGSGFDSTDKNGLSHFTLSLLDQGAGNLSAQQIQDQLNYYGTELDVQTGRENGWVSLSGLSFHSEILWKLFATIITQPQFTNKEAEDLKEKLIQERRQSLDEKTSTAYEVWLKTLFPKQNFSLPVSGTISSIRNFKKQDIRRFYNSHILDSLKILSITGNFDDSLKKKILSSLKNQKNSEENSFFDKFKKSSKARQGHNFSILSNSIKPTGTTKGGSFYFLTKKDLSQSEVLVGFPLTSFPKNHFREYFAFSLANEVFGGFSLSSRLMTQLRGEKGLTYGINSMRAAKREYGFFLIQGNSRTQTTAAFLKGILQLLKELKEQNISKEELEQAKTRKKNSFLADIETMENHADIYIYYKYGLNTTEGFLKNYITSIDSITLNEVRQALQTNIYLDRLHILVYGHPGIKESLNKVKTITQTLSFEKYFQKELSFKGQELK